jgi:hypothetical protein
MADKRGPPEKGGRSDKPMAAPEAVVASGEAEETSPPSAWGKARKPERPARTPTITIAATAMWAT